MDAELDEIDRDGAIRDAMDGLGLTRRQALRNGAAGAVGAAAAGGLLIGAPEAMAKGRKTDLKVLQLAYLLEGLGVTFYGLAARGGDLSGKTQLFAQTVYGHEIAHRAFIANAIRGMGATPAAPPKFHFGSIPHDARRFRRNAEAIESMCVQVINGAGPLVTRPLLAAAGELVSVEARHVSWIRQIIGVTPAPAAFDTTKTAAQTKRKLKSLGFVKSF